MESGSLTEEQLARTFDRWWPDLEKALSNLPNDEGEVVKDVPEELVIGEIRYRQEYFTANATR